MNLLKNTMIFLYPIRIIVAVLFVTVFSIFTIRMSQIDSEVQEFTEEDWELPPGLNEYDLGMNTVEYLEGMMPIIEDDVAQDRIETIRDKLLKAVKLRDGVDEIQIHLVNSEEVGAWALPGGFVLITNAFYNLCQTDDELAFILGHEIAHVLKGHVNNPMEERLQGKYQNALEQLGLESGAAFSEEFAAISAENMVNMITKQKELDADKQGILYTVLAGYDANAAFDITDRAVESGEGVQHPSKTVRMQKLRERIGNFIDQSEKFHAGVMFYLLGDLDLSEKAFRGFLQTFPSREVYNNLGVVYYSKALQKLPITEVSTLKSLHIDTRTIVDDFVLRGGGTEKYRRFLKKARERFEEAIERDPEYGVGYFNLACVLDDLGEYSLAINYLEKAKKFGWDEDQCTNTFASILIHQKKYVEAKSILTTIQNLDEAIFNLGALERFTDGNPTQYFKEFLARTNNLTIFAEFAANVIGTEFSKSIPRQSPNLPEFDIEIDSDKSKVLKLMGQPLKEITILSYDDITVWPYPEKSLKIYFVGDKVLKKKICGDYSNSQF